MFMTDEFPGCCGLSVISELGMPYDWGTKKEARSDLLDQINDANIKGDIVLVTINTKQKPFWGSILTSLHFKLLQSFKNPHTSNMVYLYSRKI